MIEHRDQFKKFVRGEDIDPQKFESALSHLVDVVVRRHFNWYRDESELRSMARERVMEILNGELDEENEGYINYLYTGIRNKLTNELRADKKSFSRTESGSAEDHSEIEGVSPQYSLNSLDSETFLEKASRFVNSERLKKHFAGMFLFREYLFNGV